ncbi:MAG: phosphatase PAP2 family protein [Solobacterium sp.]|nr:phosphatase PAP2 family protein [Solobacterium sp.]
MDITILLWLQAFRNGIGAFLAEFMTKMTFLGEINTVLVIMAVIYWCLSKNAGTYLLMGWSGNRIVNGFLKVTACAYRPWIRDARIIPYGNSMTTATGYSFPSGHSMNASSLYGGGAVRKDFSPVLRIALGITVFLVAFSRIFLGVHTPQDILIGIIAGLTVMRLTVELMKWLKDHPEKDTMVMLAGIAAASLVAVYAALKPYPMDYDAAGKLLVDGHKMANDTFKGVGWCIGFLTGWVLEKRYVVFSTDIPMMTRITRCAVGLLGFYVISLICMPLIKNVIPGAAVTVVTCFLQMFYIAYLFPWCITRLEEPKQGGQHPF